MQGLSVHFALKETSHTGILNNTREKIPSQMQPSPGSGQGSSHGLHQADEHLTHGKLFPMRAMEMRPAKLPTQCIHCEQLKNFSDTDV